MNKNDESRHELTEAIKAVGLALGVSTDPLQSPALLLTAEIRALTEAVNRLNLTVKNLETRKP
jgi:hypothetical protein